MTALRFQTGGDIRHPRPPFGGREREREIKMETKKERENERETHRERQRESKKGGGGEDDANLSNSRRWFNGRR